MSRDEWFAANRAMWDERAPIHAASAFYDVAGFRSGRETLQPHELDDVGPVAGKRLVHLQCHFGLDTLSWARHGADVTGLDFSGPAIAKATELAAELDIPARFIAANVYDALDVLDEGQFDIVYVNVGAIVWLPDIAAWAGIAARLLRPGGFLYLFESHPFASTLADDGLAVMHGYSSAAPLRWDEPGTYTDSEVETRENVSYEWVHPIGEVITALLAAGLRIELFREYTWALWGRWPFLEKQGRRYVFPAGMPGVPVMYSLKAVRPAP